MSTHEMRIGLEIETLLGQRDANAKELSLENFAKMAAKSYNAKIDRKKYLTMHADIGGTWDGDEYKDWSLTDDATIVGATKTKYPVEFVSPILHYDATGIWRAHVQNLFKTMRELYLLESNRSCGFHVHLSPAAGAWSLQELKAICMAVVYFEDAFEAIVPEHRRGNQWIKSNRIDNPELASLPTAKIFERIKACKNAVEISDLMHSDRYYAWNFTNLYYGGKATIEWRRPPGVTTAEGSLVWAELAIDFLQSARRPSVQFGQYSRDVEGLRAFVGDGVVAGMSDERYLKPIFEGKSGSLKPLKLKEMDKDMLQKKAKQDKKKNLMMKKLREALAKNPYPN
ncbi:hypothetical protein INS49_013372 [Diaporthe citri]|uniref:uncharacterized protein n=1 Tax=Diaporthe citri TaxID=83186 RepID=UPI001C7F769C|nr:uncharacterized protein INS49_013372 [Diaporthe citri]KAG6357495.1 hypothetical protein INS49_013372 [Diaporthe citri]